MCAGAATAAAQTAPKVGSKAELGILFVHGIGEQKQGQTLIRFADPISGWLAAWLTRGRWTEAGVRAGDDIRVSLEDANLAGDDPAHLVMTIAKAGELSLPGNHRWLLAESWWAESFYPPRTTTLLLWLLLIAPYMILVQFFEQFRHACRPPSTPTLPRRVGRWARVAAFFGVYLSALPLAALVALVVAVLLFGMLVPIQQVSDRAKKLALLLANTVGDSFVLISSAVQFDAMVSRVGRDLAWLSDRAEHVVIVAHSQGTSVGYAALRAGHAPRNLRGFVTVGEAIKKLGLMHELQSHGEERASFEQLQRVGIRQWLAHSFERWARLKSLRFGLAWAGLFGVYLFAYALPQLLVVGLKEPTHIVRGIVLVVVAVAVAGFVLWVCASYWLKDLLRVDEPLESGSGPVRWADFYASADPVPNGPLFADGADTTFLREREVWNFGSIVRDHTTYTSSEDDFLGCVVGELVAATGRSLPDETRAELTRGRWRGWWRVWCLTTARVLAFAAAIVTIVRVGSHLAKIGTRVSGWDHWGPLKGVGKHAVEGLRKLIIIGHPTNAQVVGAATVVLVAAAGYVVLAAVWAYWQRQDVKRFYRRFGAAEDTDPLGGRELLLFLSTLALEGVIAFSIWITGDYAAAWKWMTGHWWAVGGIVVGLALGPIAFAWALREELCRVEAWLMRLFPRDPREPGGETAEAVPAPAPIGP